MFRAVTVRKSSFPRGSPDFHQSPGRTDPLNCRPVNTKNRSWNFSDLEIFSNFFFFRSFSLFQPLSFIQVPATASLPRRRDLEKFFIFSDSDIFSTFLIFQLFDTVSLRPSDRLHFRRYQVTSFGQSSAAFWHFLKICYFFHFQLIFIPVCRSPSLSFFFAVFHLLSTANFFFFQAFIFSRLIVFVQYPRKKCEPI
jgi:hypothetical protein